MNDKKHLLLLSVGLALLLCIVALVASISPAAVAQQDNTGGNQNMTATITTNNTATSTAGTLDCQMAASALGGLVIPNPTGVCDVAVPRQGLQVQDTATGATLNNLLVINPLFEFTQVSNQGTTGAANQTMVYGFAEFALMEGELPSAMRMLSNSSWNVIAVHNHVIGESPSMIFAHAVANGDINTLVRDARIVLDSLMTQMQSQSGNQTSTTAAGGGGGGGNATTTGGGTTGDNMNSSPSAGSLTGGTTTGEGATAGGGVGTFGGGSGTGPGPGIGTTEGGGQQQGEGGTTTASGGGSGDGGGDDTTGGAAGPQVRP
ncbi:MAG: DUF1259 domain-containing protein [Thermoproteota archaeon]|nr:DUF1259 domain-containing protein [Thermoproteota archaeon]